MLRDAEQALIKLKASGFTEGTLQCRKKKRKYRDQKKFIRKKKTISICCKKNIIGV